MANPKPTWILLFVCLLCLNEFLISLASNQISYSNSLTGNKTIISPGGNFELGFFLLGNKSTSPNYYLGIWYKKLPQFTPVWIANRNAPISDPSTSELTVSANGNLILLDQNKTQIWSTNLTSINSNSSISELLSTGNLVLRESLDSTSSLLWQSIDHPTDTLLSGGKLGKLKATGSQKMISWKNSLDPEEGIFSFELDPNGSSQFFIFWNNSKPFWKSGEWNGKFFDNVPEMYASFDPGRGLVHKFVSNENETYYTYLTQNDSNLWRFLLDKSGQIKPMTWMEESQEWYVFWTQPEAQCDVYELCGPFGICNEQSSSYCSCVKGFKEVNHRDQELGDPSGGCQRNSPLQCGTNNSYLSNVHTDKFYAMSSVGLPNNPQSLYNDNVEDCRRACLENCSCNAYAYNNNCSVWYGDLLNLDQESDISNGETLFVRISASEFNHTMNKKKMVTWAFIGSAIGSVVFVIFIFLLVRRCQRRKFVLSMNALENGLVAFRYSDLRRITNNFSELLGKGGFGSVFKGTLPNSSTVAVKRLESIVELVGEKQFRNEVRTIGIIQHINLVRLRGFCSEGSKRLLIYDNMQNGSLDKQLFQRNSSHLNWKTRYQIALGTARGLAYLHESCVECIIHCDVKPENILLDELFIPKVADFGMAKLVGRDFSRVITTLRGTIGYLAPEWISGTAISTKVDVYSYGLVLLELISGRRNREQLGEESGGYFPLLAVIELKEGNILTLLDPDLNGDANFGEVERVCRVACWCIQDNEHSRPIMSQVVQIFEGSLEVSMPPIPRSLIALVDE